MSTLDDVSSDFIMKELTSLFSSKSYRILYASALSQYWLQDKNTLTEIDLSMFNGTKLADELIEKLKARLVNEHDKSVVVALKLFYIIHKLELLVNSYPSKIEVRKSEFYRNKGYLLLDWVPALAGMVDVNTLANTLLLSAISFHQASLEEMLAEYRMADEKIAFRLYLLAAHTARKSTPDVELYALTHVLHYLAQLKYSDDELNKVIPQLQQRCLFIADFYPFYESCKPNIELVSRNNKNILLLRKYLQSLVAQYEKSHGKWQCDLDYLNVIFEAYESCCKNWYKTEIDTAEEERFRQTLMQELLRINHWTFTDISQFITSEGITGFSTDWHCPILPATSDLDQYFTSLDGIEIDHTSGEITIITTPAQRDTSLFNQYFNLNDVKEIFGKNVTSAVFSLDPPDPDRSYHPFNKMRFAPSCLYRTQLLNTMLLADLLLKFLTIGYEVVLKQPYLIRKTDELLSVLPLHLKKIIRDFNAASKAESVNRFWIETEEVPTALEDGSDKIKIVFGDIKMRVMKHSMVRDAAGNLKDNNNEEEGWDIYILNSDSVSGSDITTSLEQHIRDLDRPAIINRNGFFEFYEQGQYTTNVSLKETDACMQRLKKLKLSSYGKILIENSESQRIVYSLTKKCCDLAKKPYLFSPEYVFAQEFTNHFKEFAAYFPILARLCELSKIVIMTRVLVHHRTQNIKKLAEEKNDLDSQMHYFHISQQILPIVKKSVDEQLNSIREQTEYEKIPQKRRESLNRLLTEIGTLNYAVDSYEVMNIALEKYDEQKNHIVSDQGENVWCDLRDKIWSKIVDKLPELASEMTKQKVATTSEQLINTFQDKLTDCSRATLLSMVSAYLNGDNDTLLNSLIESDYKDICRQYSASCYPEVSLDILKNALDGSLDAVNAIILAQVRININKILNNERERIVKREKLEKAFSNMGLAATQEEVDLSNRCLWVPASVHHQINDTHSRLVYGGVQISGKLNLLRDGAPAMNQSYLSSINQGIKVYRMWGADALPFGRYWTTVNPNHMSNPREQLGLPKSNTGRFVSEGVIRGDGWFTRPAVPLHGNKGGDPEILIPNSKCQVKLTRVSGVNPQY